MMSLPSVNSTVAYAVYSPTKKRQRTGRVPDQDFVEETITGVVGGKGWAGSEGGSGAVGPGAGGIGGGGEVGGKIGEDGGGVGGCTASEGGKNQAGHGFEGGWIHVEV